MPEPVLKDVMNALNVGNMLNPQIKSNAGVRNPHPTSLRLCSIDIFFLFVILFTFYLENYCPISKITVFSAFANSESTSAPATTLDRTVANALFSSV